MSYDDDQAYDAERDRKLDTTFHRRLVVDKDYMAVTRHDPFYIFKKSPVELFSVVCKNLVAGMRIAVKIKDNDLPSRFWIVDVLESVANLYVGNTQNTVVSAADSRRMAEAFKPVLPLFKKWAEGRPKYADKMDFQTGSRPRLFAGELDNLFIWLYDRLREKGHDMVAAVHPILFMPASKEYGDEISYTFLSGKFQTLLSHCAIYRERHTIPTEIDKMFEAEMRKPADERFFNIDDDADESMYENGDVDEATNRSRLKAYMQYREQAYRLHTTPRGACNGGFAYVRDELSRYLQDAKNTVLHVYLTPMKELNILYELMGRRPVSEESWYDLLYDLLKMKPFISYRDFNTDGYSEEDKTSDAGYHDDDGWPYFEVVQNIPEHDICREVHRDFEEYLETLTALAFCVQSTVYPKLVSALEDYKSRHNLSFVISRKDDYYKNIIDIMKDTINRLELEVRLYKKGKIMLAPFDKAAEDLKECLVDHDKKMDSGFDAAQRDSAEILAQERESQELAQATNDNTLTLKRMLRTQSKHGRVSIEFSKSDQKKCYDLWVTDRVDPLLANGHKPYRKDSFEKHKRMLAAIGITDADIYSTLIIRYMKREKITIPNTKRKLAANRKPEEKAEKRKNAPKKRKNTPGDRKAE